MRVAPMVNESVKTVFKTILQLGALDERRDVRAWARSAGMITAATNIAFTGLGKVCVQAHNLRLNTAVFVKRWGVGSRHQA